MLTLLIAVQLPVQLGTLTVVPPRLAARTSIGRLQSTMTAAPGTCTSVMAIWTASVRTIPFLCVASGSKIEFWNLGFVGVKFFEACNLTIN
jgi:hypothetical protein